MKEVKFTESQRKLVYELATGFLFKSEECSKSKTAREIRNKVK